VEFETRTDSQGYVRSIIYPVQSGKYFLTITYRLDQFNRQSAAFATLLFLAGITILTCFALLQHKLRGRNLAAIRRLTKVINRTDTELVPPAFKVSDAAAPDVQELARCYNKMMTRRSNNLRRARQFAADVTHELRTPLTILRGETELALRSGRDQEQLQQVLASNLEEISRMSYLIEDLLLLSKGDLGEIPLKMEHLDFNELITELHHQAQLLATAKNIKVELQAPKEVINLQADSFRLRQVLLNLLTNAIKYTPDDGDVFIKIESDGNFVTISVIDSGIGMDEEHLELIFNRFYRVDKTGNRNDGGSGLGLAIVKWIVDAHQGTIRVTSTPGQGSRFTVILPLEQKEIIVEAVTEDDY
jgi:heavy metal sensor kinase